MIDAHKEKYHGLYWKMAEVAALQSVAERNKVGCIIVAPTGMISVGWNGMPAGWFTNSCEYVEGPGEAFRVVTKPEVIHAERNAIDKMTRQGVPVEGSILFTTLAPCLECAKSMHGLGFKHIYYRTAYRQTCGIDFLEKLGVPVTQS